MTPDAGVAVSIDIGGTFTDVVATDRKGSLHISKVLTTPADLVRCCVEGVSAVMSEFDDPTPPVTRLVHATTQATNVLIEGKRPPVAFLITEGFRDLATLLGGGRLDAFDLLWDQWEPPVDRERTYEVPERIGAHGEVLRELDEEAVRLIGADLAVNPPDAVGICLFNAYAFPDHERRVRDILLESLPPTCFVALSSEVWPEYGEASRALATIFSAYIGPVMTGYLSRLGEELSPWNASGLIQVMQSNGGTVSAEQASVRPLPSIESGPAAGALAAGYVGMNSRYDKLISFDMGGTTAKVALIERGQPRTRTGFRLGGTSVSADTSEGTGVLLDIPVLDLVEVGAGGGSIAWVDPGGLLKVGPRSASAHPGPACYGFGGTSPTVTDANLVLGYLSPAYFLGGAMALRPDLAEEALATIAASLGVSTVEAAAAVHDIATLTMEDALRMVTVGRGIDPRDYTLMGFGGAGPMHVARLAEAFGISRVAVPPVPGLFSSVGLLTSDMVYENVRTVFLSYETSTASDLNAIFRELEELPVKQVEAGGFDPAAVVVERSVDIRHRLQRGDLTIPVPSSNLDATEYEALRDAFHTRYERAYGIRREHEPIVIRSCRVRVRGRSAGVELPQVSTGDGDIARARKGTRPVFFRELGGFTDVQVFERGLLGGGTAFAGPAIIEELDSTIVVPPAWQGSVEATGNVVLQREARTSS